MEGIDIKLNKYQSPLNEELKNELPKEVWDDIIEYTTSVKFIDNLISPDREYISDRPILTYINKDGETKDYEDGRKLIDLTNPHILEDMDFFRERALFFDKHGKYTNITPNANPKSDYAQFWKEELRRWKYGLIRDDGEWIPGELYFYWNYSPIPLVELVENSKSSVRGERVRSFPKPWLGDYLFFHYVNQAREEGKHGKLLKCRGVGFSLKTAAWSPRNMYVFPGSQNPNFHLASEKSFLTGDKGIWGKILDVLDWIGTHTPLPKMRLVDKKQAMEVQLGYEDEYGSRKGLLSSAYGVSLKDNPDKARGVRGPLIHYEEDGLFPNLEKAWNVNRKAVEDGGVASGFMLSGGCLTENNMVWTNDGRNISIKDLKQSDGIIGYDGEIGLQEKINWFKPPTKKECIRITTTGGNFIECSVDHPILTTRGHWRKKMNNEVVGKFTEFKRADKLAVRDQLVTIDELQLFGNQNSPHARLLGLAIGDGCYREGQSVRVSCGDREIYEYLTNKYDCNTNDTSLQKDGSFYCNVSLRGVQDIFREAGIYGDVNEHKKLPTNIHTFDKESLAKLLGGYFDADGNVYYNKKRDRVRIVLTSKHSHLLEQVKNQLIKFGIHGKIYKELRKSGYKPNTYVHRLYITSSTDIKRFKDNIPLLCDRKRENLEKLENHSNTDNTRITKGFFKYNKKNGKGKYLKEKETLTNIRQESITKIEYIGKKEVYNLNTSVTNSYLGNNFISANTGGVEGKSFEGSEKLFYNPRAYNIYGIPNVFDINTNGETICGFFWGAYLNRNNCYDLNNGEPDVIKALVEICLDRYEVKYNSSDTNAITQKKAEEPITPQEAVMRTEGTIFPVADLKQYLESISATKDRFLAEHLFGDLVYQNDGSLSLKQSNNRYPLRSYDVTETDKTGCLEIFEIPKKNGEGIVTRGRYIAGIDPIDADRGQSLFSILVMDTFTDRIVAEYSGRPKTAVEAYDIALRLLKYYNAEANYESNLKGLFSYFDSQNALHYLCSNPQILKDMELVKAQGTYGNLAKGTHPNARINSWGRQLQADWMLKPIDPNSEEGDKNYGKLNMHGLRSLAYIEECIKWNADGNFDRVSAGGMLFILREDRYKRIKSAKENMDNPRVTLADDSFFTKNYKPEEELLNRNRRLMGGL